MRIILDGMGGDNAPDAIVEGACLAAQEMLEGSDIVIVGQENVIKVSLSHFS